MQNLILSAGNIQEKAVEAISCILCYYPELLVELLSSEKWSAAI